ncbi:hypothetical protein RMATCC62417_13630 [Rhizopus microsporus]|nr:hypothetical protein RMATCC62417_13630 [Rhizopus microsporus]
MVMPVKPIPSVTDKIFLSENEIFSIIQAYFSETTFTAEQLQDWMGKDCSWGVTKRKQIDNERKRGREINVVKEELRAFTWEDISNVKEFRHLVRTTSNDFVTIGYARKSRTRENKSAVESSLNLQIQKLRTKCLCQLVFTSANTNTDDPIEERDLQKNKKYIIKNNAGDAQDMIEYISMSTKKIRLVVIDYAGLSTNPDHVRLFFR